MPQSPLPLGVGQADSVETRYTEVARRVTALQLRCRHGLCCLALLDSLSELLGSLPLTTEEFGRAACHLANAGRYLASGERGAGGYELRMLASVLSPA